MVPLIHAAPTLIRISEPAVLLGWPGWLIGICLHVRIEPTLLLSPPSLSLGRVSNDVLLPSPCLDAEAPNCPLQNRQLNPLSTSTKTRQHLHPAATMSATTVEFLTSGSSGKSTRTLLRVIILALIAGAAIASRLFSVIRKCPFSVRAGACGAGHQLLLSQSLSRNASAQGKK